MTSRILIVDDERLVLNGFKTALELAGFSVFAEQSPAAALKLVEETSLDLVVLDFIMPDMDGIELLARIRRHQPLVRSIIVSGKLDGGRSEDQITKAIEGQIEADLYLHKPISNDRLTEAVGRLLSQSHEGNWATIAEQLVRRQGSPIRKAKAASKTLKTFVKKKR